MTGCSTPALGVPVVTAPIGFHSASVRSQSGRGRLASGAYPHMAAVFTEDAGPIDLEAVFGRALDRVVDAFAPR